MSYYLMHRGWMEKRIFEREPFDRRSAWVWLIEHAMFEDTKHLRRGQLRVTVRGLADAWRWEPAKVQRYIAAMQHSEMIGCIADTHGTTITICNYDEYQADKRIGDTVPDTHPIHTRYTPDTPYKEGKKEEDTFPNGKGQNLPSRREIAESMVEVWKAELGGVLSIPSKLTDRRITLANTRLTGDFHGDLGEWRAYCKAIHGTPFLIGDNDRQWRANFDWALEPRAVLGVREGKYERGAGRAPVNDPLPGI